MLYFSDIMLTSIENVSSVSNNNTLTAVSASNTTTTTANATKSSGDSGGASTDAGTVNHDELDGNSTVASAAVMAVGGSNSHAHKAAKAVLICHPNSHSFGDRTLVLDKPVKIGRSVGHNKTSAGNGIFDCKVLSRNHALLWFEDGKFLLRDTRSSNGTFVNAERLSKSGDESPPREVFSGDTVQFGVDVVENSRNVTHGCVIATLKLILANGREAKATPAAFVPAHGYGNKVSLEDLYHLNQYLQDSLQREQMLEFKLHALQTLMETLRDSTELGWKALISNNNLLSRVELLEMQLKCYSKKFADDQLREQLRNLQEDKNTYENAVKQYFQKIVDEKIEATQQCQDLNRAQADAKVEFANAQLLLTSCQAELRQLAQKNAAQELTIEELLVKIQLSEERSNGTLQKIVDEKATLQDQINTLTSNEAVLQQTIKELETHGDYAHKQVMSLESQVEELQKHHSDILCELVDPAVIRDKINDVDLVRSWMAIYGEALRKCRENAATVRKRAEQLRCEKALAQQKVVFLECELNKCAIELEDCRAEQAVLEAKIIEHNSEQELFKPVPDILDELNEKKCVGASENGVVSLQEQHKLLNVIQRDICATETHYQGLESAVRLAKEERVNVTVSHAIEEDKLRLHEKQLSNLETVVRTLNEHVESLDTYQKEVVSIEDVQSLKKQLFEAHAMGQEKQNVTIRLMKHFSQFVDLISGKLDAVETTITGSVISQDDLGSVDELRLLKSESGSLVAAVNQLQSSLEDAFSSTATATEHSICDRVDHRQWERSSAQPAHNDLIVIFKEKLRCLESEKRLLENDLVSLQQQYNYLKSYPYFDLYFILPIVLLVLVLIFNFGDKLSHVFGTRG